MVAGRRTGAPSSSSSGMKTTTTKSPSSRNKAAIGNASSPATRKPKAAAKPKGGKGGIAVRGAKAGGSPSPATEKGRKQTKHPLVAVKGAKDEGKDTKGKGAKLQEKGKQPQRIVSKDPKDSKDPTKPKKKIRGKKRGRKAAVILVDPDTEDAGLPPSKRLRETEGGDAAAVEGAAAEPTVLRPFYESVEAFLEANAGSWELMQSDSKEESKEDSPTDNAAAKQQKQQKKKPKQDDAVTFSSSAAASVRWSARDGRQLCILPARIDDINAFIGGKKYAKLKLDALKVQVEVKTKDDDDDDDEDEEPSARTRPPTPPRPQLVKNLRGCCSNCSHLAQACVGNHADCARAILEAARSRGAKALERVLCSSADAKACFLPLHSAAFAGQVPMLKLLVEGYGADINAPAWGSGLTPVMIAARAGLAESAAWMAEHGAKLSARTTGYYKEVRPGKCAMDLARTITKEERRNATVEALRINAAGGARKPTTAALKGGEKKKKKKTNEQEPEPEAAASLPRKNPQKKTR